MKFIFKPQKSIIDTQISLIGSFLNYDGTEIDLDSFPDGSYSENELITVDKTNDLTLTVIWKYTEDTLINRFPQDVNDPIDGIIKPLTSTKDN